MHGGTDSNLLLLPLAKKPFNSMTMTILLNEFCIPALLFKLLIKKKGGKSTRLMWDYWYFFFFGWLLICCIFGKHHIKCKTQGPIKNLSHGLMMRSKIFYYLKLVALQLGYHTRSGAITINKARINLFINKITFGLHLIISHH